MTEQFRAFYSSGGLNAETYDIRTETPPGEIDFYVERARLSGGPVLELGCGTGRVTWPIARAGIRTVGLDLESAMLEQAIRKGAAEPEDVRARARFVRGNMTSFDLGERFALTIIPYRAFLMLLTIEDQRRALVTIHNHLQPNGALIIDIFDPRYDMLAEEQLTPPRAFPSHRNPATGHTVSVTVIDRVNDRVAQRFRERWRFQETAADGRVMRTEDEVLELRWIFRYEMRHLLELCGFTVEQELSDYFGARPEYGREQIWIALRALA